MRYPTNDPLIDELTEFGAARLQKPNDPVNGKPCQAEDWWVADRIEEGRRFPLPKLSQEDGLRFCWRRARDNNIERLFKKGAAILGEPADLLLHQMTELSPTLFGAARNVGL